MKVTMKHKAAEREDPEFDLKKFRKLCEQGRKDFKKRSPELWKRLRQIGKLLLIVAIGWPKISFL